MGNQQSELHFDVALIRSSSILYDPRVRKIIKSLAKKYRLIALDWNREATCNSFEYVEKNIVIKRALRASVFFVS
jgi:hypothetical protein